MVEEWTWDDTDGMLAEVRGWAVQDGCLPLSAAVVFHSGRLGAVLEVPMFALEHAEVITDELCRFLPSVYPHQLALIRPAIYDDLDVDGTLYAMQVLLWERDGATRNLVVPVPILGGVDGPTFVAESCDPWFARVVEAVDGEVPWPPLIDTRFPPGYELLVLRDSPMAAMFEMLELQDAEGGG